MRMTLNEITSLIRRVICEFYDQATVSRVRSDQRLSADDIERVVRMHVHYLTDPAGSRDDVESIRRVIDQLWTRLMDSVHDDKRAYSSLTKMRNNTYSLVRLYHEMVDSPDASAAEAYEDASHRLWRYVDANVDDVVRAVNKTRKAMKAASPEPQPQAPVLAPLGQRPSDAAASVKTVRRRI